MRWRIDFSIGEVDFDQNFRGCKYASTAPVTAPQPLWPSMTTTLTLSLRAFRAKSMLPRHSSPRTLPATRMTNRSLNPWPKLISVGTRASEQPTTTAKGDCLGICPCVLGMPTSRPLQATTYWGSVPLVTVLVRQLSIHRAKSWFPSMSRCLAVSAFSGSGLAVGFLGSNR